MSGLKINDTNVNLTLELNSDKTNNLYKWKEVFGAKLVGELGNVAKVVGTGETYFESPIQQSDWQLEPALMPAGLSAAAKDAWKAAQDIEDAALKLVLKTARLKEAGVRKAQWPIVFARIEASLGQLTTITVKGDAAYPAAKAADSPELLMTIINRTLGGTAVGVVSAIEKVRFSQKAIKCSLTSRCSQQMSLERSTSGIKT